MKGTLLILDDDRPFSERASAFAHEMGFDVSTAVTLQDAHAALERKTFDYALIDIGLPDGCGLELLADRRLASTSKIVMSGDSALAQWAGRQLPNALGSLTKPFRFSAFNELLARRRDVEAGTATSSARHGLLGTSASIVALSRELRAVAASRFPVLIHGASGTGKELAARLVHHASRRPGRLVTVNCAGLAPELLASQLFGHRRGSFTGAVDTHPGLVEQAEGGTLFLDEITEASDAVQTSLLRFLESGEFTPLGARGPQMADVRVIAATNRDPRQAIADGRLRADLYFRVAGYEVSMPPLRDRPEDVEIIAQGILNALNREYGEHRRFAGHAFDALRDYEWSGNVRELRQVVQRAWIGGAQPLVLELPSAAPASGGVRANDEQSPGTLEQIERHAILRALKACRNDRTAAARLLGVSTKTVYNKLARYDRESG